MKLPLLFLFLFACLTALPALAHKGEKHKEKEKPKSEQTAQADTTQKQAERSAKADVPVKVLMGHARIEDFPNLHPLLVHFPIVLLIVAALVSVFNVLGRKKELDWMVAVLTFVALCFAFYVTEIAHPHTGGLTDQAKLVLQQHDRYAYWTIYAAAFSFLVQLLKQLVLPPGRVWAAAVAGSLFVASYFVAMAGHYGAQLLHIEGVGPQGKYLDEHHH